jgi:hypothetical protein
VALTLIGRFTVAVVWKPLLGTVVTGASDEGDSPSSSCQEAISVAPFQLVYTVTVVPLLVAVCVAAIAGGSLGCPVQGERLVRKFCTPLPSVPSSSTAPLELYSVKLGRLPYPISQSPPGSDSVLPWAAADSVLVGLTKALTRETVLLL